MPPQILGSFSSFLCQKQIRKGPRSGRMSIGVQRGANLELILELAVSRLLFLLLDEYGTNQRLLVQQKLSASLKPQQ